MKARKLFLLPFVVIASFLAILHSASAQNAPTPNASPSQMGMMSGMTPEQCRDMMKQKGMSDAFILRCKMLGSAAVPAFDPAAILALRSDLKLTDEQVAAFQAIADKATTEAKAKLTADQLAILQPIADSPQSMKQLCSEMMGKMHHDDSAHPMDMMMGCCQ